MTEAIIAVTDFRKAYGDFIASDLVSPYLDGIAMQLANTGLIVHILILLAILVQLPPPQVSIVATKKNSD